MNIKKIYLRHLEIGRSRQSQNIFSQVYERIVEDVPHFLNSVDYF